MRSVVLVIMTALAAGCAASTAAKDADVRLIKDASPLERRLAANPNDVHVNVELGDQASSGGDWLRAEQYYARAEALGAPPALVMPRLLRALVLGRRYDEALERCRHRLAHAPEDRATRLVQAALLAALDRPRDAERELDTLVRTRPSDPNPYLALAKLYRDSYHDAVRARPLFEKYLALAPKGDEAESVRYELESVEPPEPLPGAAATPAPGATATPAPGAAATPAPGAAATPAPAATPGATP